MGDRNVLGGTESKIPNRNSSNTSTKIEKKKKKGKILKENAGISLKRGGGSNNKLHLADENQV